MLNTRMLICCFASLLVCLSSTVYANTALLNSINQEYDVALKQKEDLTLDISNLSLKRIRLNSEIKQTKIKLEKNNAHIQQLLKQQEKDTSSKLDREIQDAMYKSMMVESSISSQQKKLDRVVNKENKNKQKLNKVNRSIKSLKQKLADAKSQAAEMAEKKQKEKENVQLASITKKSAVPVPSIKTVISAPVENIVKPVAAPVKQPVKKMDPIEVFVSQESFDCKDIRFTGSSSNKQYKYLSQLDKMQVDYAHRQEQEKVSRGGTSNNPVLSEYFLIGDKINYCSKELRQNLVFKNLGNDQYELVTTVEEGNQRFTVGDHTFSALIPMKDDGEKYKFLLNLKDKNKPQLIWFKSSLLNVKVKG